MICTSPPLFNQMKYQLGQGGVTPIGAVSRAATRVKMQSNGQGTFWGLVKQSSTVLGHYRSNHLATKKCGRPFAHVQQIHDQGSRAKIQRGQAVKAIFQRSKILTVVVSLDMASTGVTPPPCRG